MPQTLAQLVKAKYPGVYDDIDDADLEQRVRAKYPGAYDDLPLTVGGSKVKPIPPGAKPGGGLYGGPEAKLSAGEPESALSRGYGAVKEAIFGHPDRAEAREAGIGLQPTPAEMAGTAVGLGATSLVGGGAMRGAMALPGLAGRIAGPTVRAAASPVGAGAIAGAGTLMAGGDTSTAVTNALLAGVGARQVPAVSRMARATAKAAPKARPQAVPSAPKQAPKSAPKAAPKAQPVAKEPPAEVAKAAAPSRGKEVADRHKELMQFGKKIAAEDPKVGEKIWILLDDAGRPVKRLTSDQAGAAARKGQRTTWVRNLWARR